MQPETSPLLCFTCGERPRARAGYRDNGQQSWRPQCGRCYRRSRDSKLRHDTLTIDLAALRKACVAVSDQLAVVLKLLSPEAAQPASATAVPAPEPPKAPEAKPPITLRRSRRSPAQIAAAIEAAKRGEVMLWPVDTGDDLI